MEAYVRGVCRCALCAIALPSAFQTELALNNACGVVVVNACAMQVQSFHETIAVDVGVSSMTDLCDGVFLAKIMHQMYVVHMHAAGVVTKNADMLPLAFTRLKEGVCVWVWVFLCVCYTTATPST